MMERKSSTGHILSSQMACLNHLFALRKNPDAVLAVLNGVRNEFTEVLPITSDKDNGYIAFEVVSDSHQTALHSGRTPN